MKIAVVGGAGTRVPLLVLGLLRFHQELGTREVALWDVNPEKGPMIARICEALIRRYQIPLRVYLAGSVEEAFDGADFVICSIRVGGAAGRIADESIALAHGVLGQETVGPGGWAMALRTIPPMLEYTRLMERRAPRAWLVSFTNPVGIILQATLAQGAERVLGVCDTPRELFEMMSHELGVEGERAFFDYFGLNHLGWVRQVLVDGQDVLAPLFDETRRLAKFYRVPLFEPAFLQEHRLIPTEYVYFYYRTRHAVEKIQRQETTRGRMVAQQEDELFRQLANDGGDPDRTLRAYEDYLAQREGTYFQLESGESLGVRQEDSDKMRRELYQRAAGYERIGVDVMRAIRCHQPTVMPLDVANRGSIDGLEASDAVEVPSVIDANGGRPLAVGAVPAAVRDLFFQVKDYERLTVEAAREGSMTLAVDALAANPLVRDRALAQALAEEYRAAHQPWLDYLR